MDVFEPDPLKPSYFSFIFQYGYIHQTGSIKTSLGTSLVYVYQAFLTNIL